MRNKNEILPSDVPRCISGSHCSPSFIHVQSFCESIKFCFVREKLTRLQQFGIGQVFEKLKPEIGRSFVIRNVRHGHNRASSVCVTEITRKISEAHWCSNDFVLGDYEIWLVKIPLSPKQV